MNRFNFNEETASLIAESAKGMLTVMLRNLSEDLNKPYPLDIDMEDLEYIMNHSDEIIAVLHQQDIPEEYKDHSKALEFFNTLEHGAEMSLLLDLFDQMPIRCIVLAYLAARGRMIPVINTSMTVKEKVMLRDKVTNTLFNGTFHNYGEVIAMRMEKPGKSELTTKIKLDYEGLEKCGSAVRFSNTERRVYDSIVTLYQSGRTFITFNSINKADLSDPNARLTANKEQIIRDAVKKFQGNVVEYDHSAAFRAWSGDRTASFQGRENLLSCRMYTAVLNGKEVEGIEILAKPILFRIAESMSHYHRIAPEVLRLPQKVNGTERNLNLMNVLFREVDRVLHRKSSVKHGNDFSGTIKLITLYNAYNMTEQGANSNSRKSNMYAREVITRIMDNWIENNYIPGLNKWSFVDEIGKISTNTRKAVFIKIN